jgi:hypothetical protein
MPIILLFILFMSNYLSVGCVFPSILTLLRPRESGSAFGMLIRIQAAIDCGYNVDPDPVPDPKHWIPDRYRYGSFAKLPVFKSKGWLKPVFEVAELVFFFFCTGTT